ncbi:MAG: hypothetical protein M0T80_06980 [Actinomycetota bacterium]|nr:hypothetical protein [Actinomycetota bacterium]
MSTEGAQDHRPGEPGAEAPAPGAVEPAGPATAGGEVGRAAGVEPEGVGPAEVAPEGVGPAEVLPAGAGTGSWDLDVAAASLRIETSDTDVLFESLGDKLERILGGRVKVTREREGGMRRRTKRVTRIVVDAGGTRLEAARSRVGPSFSEAHAVRGITLRTHEITAEEWLERLVALVRVEAAGSSDVSSALGRLLQ